MKADDESQVYREIITDAEHSVRRESAEIRPSVLGLDARSAGDGDPWSVTKKTLVGGKQDGVGLITIDNGRIQIEIVETRGFSVLEVRRGSVRLGWDSPVKELVHPEWIDLSSRGGLGWLEGFNEFIARCGLEYAGAPGPDEFITNTGDKGTLDLTLHGRISNLPASKVEVLIDRKPPHEIRVRGVVHERQFHGPKLELASEISTAPGSDTFRVTDTVTNRGAQPQEFELIHHCNYGPPVLDEGATIHMPAKSVRPINGRAAEGIDSYETYLAPTAGYTEQVYLIEPLSDESGQTVALLHNAAGDVGGSIRWSIAELPCFTLWKNTVDEADGYVTGLEPGTCYPFNRKIERQFGRVPKLRPGESQRCELEFGLHASAAEVQAVREQIAAIQAGRVTEIFCEPPRVG